jgi:ribonuclease HII
MAPLRRPKLRHRSCCVIPVNPTRSAGPTFDHERALLERVSVVVGVDEVGRGALAGPVCVGAVAVVSATPEPPRGLDDSKALTPAQRTGLVPLIRAWAHGFALGWASAREVDRVGIVGALRAAGERALGQLEGDGVEVSDAIVLLDGSHNWLTPPPMLEQAASGSASGRWRTVTLVGADRLAVCVAAASVLAKCARDAAMVALDRRHPEYGWDRNKGYGTAEHRTVISGLGPCPEHRQSWKLVGS